jgi:hypothetical protein
VLFFTVMKRLFLWLVAIISGICLFLPDPIPFVDEAILLAIFLKSTTSLGFNLGRWLPFFGKGKEASAPRDGTRRAKDMTVDV